MAQVFVASNHGWLKCHLKLLTYWKNVLTRIIFGTQKCKLCETKMCFSLRALCFWVNQEVHSGFSIPSYRKTWMNFLAIPINTISAAAKSLQSCPTLRDPIDGSPTGFLVPGILQARTLEWVAISFSNAWKWKVKVKLLSRVRLLATPWTAVYQAPLSMGFSRQEYWSGVPLPSPIQFLLIKKTFSLLKVKFYWFLIPRAIVVLVAELCPTLLWPHGL